MQEDIIVIGKHTAAEKGEALLNELMPTVGSRCLLKTVWETAAARGVPKRTIQRLYQRMLITSLNDDQGAWLIRGRIPGNR